MNASVDNGVQQHDTLSSLVRHLEEALPDREEMTVGEFLPYLGIHGFVFLVLVLGMLNIAIFMLPGLSILFGVPMVIIAVQMLLGLDAPLFPAFIREQKIKSEALHKGLMIAARGLEKIEFAIKPRLLLLTHPLMFRVHVVLMLVLAFMVSVPLPFINIPPTLGVILLSIGLMQRDGLFVLGAFCFTLWSLWLYESLGRAAQHFF